MKTRRMLRMECAIGAGLLKGTNESSEHLDNKARLSVFAPNAR